jgi:hypothetical protein
LIENCSLKKHCSAGKVVTAVVLLTLATSIALINVSPVTECRTQAPLEPKQHWFQAVQTVVEPWLGPHHVYGTFIIPKQFKFDHLYTAKLMIHGAPTEFQAGSPEDEDTDSGQPAPGHYVKRVYLSTRIALWFLLTGQFGDLKASCHWWLVIRDRVRQVG